MPSPSPAAPRHALAASRPARRPSARLRALLLGAPLLVLLLVVIAAAGALQPPPAASPTATTDAIGGPVVATPGITPPVDPSPTADATGAPTPTAAPTTTPGGPGTAEPEELTGFVWPLRGARLTSPFGAREGGAMIVNGQAIHDGMDLATWCGDKIRAAHSGTVLYAGRKFDEHIGYSDSLAAFYARLERSGGLKALPIVVVIDYGNGYRGVYVHLSRTIVEAGDVVTAGEVIGYEGATGNATGCHLHYGLIRMDGAWFTVAEGLVERFFYPPFARERVDPLRVMPLTHPDAPNKVRRANIVPFERQRVILGRE
jgi:murein DD-endopeptidase MepM/ murein hydrolase activator NlpD